MSNYLWPEAKESGGCQWDTQVPSEAPGLCSLHTGGDPAMSDTRWMIQEVLCAGNFGGVGGWMGEGRQFVC